MHEATPSRTASLEPEDTDTYGDHDNPIVISDIPAPTPRRRRKRPNLDGIVITNDYSDLYSNTPSPMKPKRHERHAKPFFTKWRRQQGGGDKRAKWNMAQGRQAEEMIKRAQGKCTMKVADVETRVEMCLGGYCPNQR